MARRLITERTIKAMTAPGELEVDRRCIITPAAWDAALLRGIRIVRRDGDPSSVDDGTRSRSPEATRTARTLERLGDGDYLLQIRDGRIRIFRIDDDGPRPA